MYFKYRPSITTQFKDATQKIYDFRTTNMTQSIATRIDGFEHIIRQHSSFLARLTRDVYSETNFIE